MQKVGVERAPACSLPRGEGLPPVSEHQHTSRNLHLQSKIQRKGKALLSQQCWLWGRDVKRRDGNLLLAHGFERLRAPERTSGSTQYTLGLPNEMYVRLWGFGMYFGAAKGIYVNRYEFVPRTALFQEAWLSAESMIALPKSRGFELLAQAASWIAEYESWVLKNVGLTYRRQSLSSWKEACAEPGAVALSWRRLANEIRAAERARLRHQTNGLSDIQRHSAQVP